MKSIFTSGSSRSALLLKAMVLLGIGSQMASATVVNYRYLRFTPTQLKNSTATSVQLSEFQFFNGATPIPTSGVLVTDPGDTRFGQLPPRAFDGNLDTEWHDYTYTTSSLTFDFGTSKAIDSYNYVTAADTPDSDPVSWNIEGSSDGSDWTLIDNVTGITPPLARKQPVSATNFIFPASPRPNITEFDFSDLAQPAIVPNGSSLLLYIGVDFATTAKVTNDFDSTEIPAPLDGSGVTVTPPDSRDTVYTLTATSSGGSSTKTFTIHSVAPQTQHYRYVRYTAVKVRTGTAIQMSDFSFFNGGVKVPVATVTNPGGPVQSGEPIASLIDNENATNPPTPTKWYSSAIFPVYFDFGATATFNGYSFSTGNDVPDRDPVRWTLEGSNDNTNWSLIDNVTTFDYPTTLSRNTASGKLPIPGDVAPPQVTLSSNAPLIANGESVTLTYSSAGAASVAITPGVTTSGFSGTAIVSPTATTTYTITATSPTGTTATQSVTVTVKTPLGSINYPNFESSSDLNLIGNAQVLNDHSTFTNGPNAKRLRLTDILSYNESGSAWSFSKVKVRDGFETTFDANLAFPVYVNGADGIAFTIQNSTAKYNAVPSSNLELTDSSVSIVLDSFADITGETQANLEVYVRPIPAPATPAAPTIYHLDSTGLNVARGYKGNYLVTAPTAAPYHVKIDYIPGSLSVYVDDILVVNQLPVNLGTAGAVDSDGKAWVGFSAKTHNIVAYHDIVNWSLTTGIPSTTTPLAITSSAFTFGASPQVLLTFSSTSGTKYKATQSADLVTWTQVGSTVTAIGPSTSITVPFATGSKGFFRIEQTN